MTQDKIKKAVPTGKNRRLLTKARGAVSIPVRVIKRGHQVVIADTHDGLRRHVEWYDRWHQHKHHRKVHLATLMMALVIMAGSLAGTAHIAKAFSAWLQTDWSGGGGNSTTNQYLTNSNVNAGTPGQLSVNNNNNASDWCNTAQCDSNWQYRQRINFTSDQARTDYQLHLTIPYRSAMANDFHDLRFTDINGVGDLSYAFGDNGTNGVNREIFIKLPVLEQGPNAILMYYGNASAGWVDDPSATFAFYDHFYGNSIDTNKWTVDPNLAPALSVSGSALHFDNTGSVTAGNATINPNMASLNRSDQQMFEWSASFGDMGNSGNCASFLPNLFSVGASWPSAVDQHGMSFECDRSNSGKLAVTPQAYLNGTNYTQTFSDLTNQSMDINSYRQYGIEPTVNSANYYASDGSGMLKRYTVAGVPAMTRPQLLPMLYFGTVSNGEKLNIQWVRSYKTGANITTNYDIEQYQSGGTGKLGSAVLQTGTKPYFGQTSFSLTGSGGTAGIKVRTSANADMSGATDFENCNLLASGAMISTSNCVIAGQPYLQYQMVLSQQNGGNITVTAVDLEYGDDSAPPDNASGIVVKKSINGPIIANTDWTNTQNPYISWNTANDNPGGSGVAGYCLAVSTNPTDDPTTTKGLITDNSPLNMGGLCQYATSNSSLDLSSVGHTSFNSGDTLYILVRTIDNTGNLSSQTAQAEWRFDDTPPQVGTLFTPPPAATNSGIFSATWLTIGMAMDDYSGFAGFKYCVTNANINFSGCSLSDNNWYGKAHNSGRIDDNSDVVPFSDGVLTTNSADFGRMDLGSQFGVGVNQIYFVAIDNAGNVLSLGSPTMVLISQHVAGAPTNLSVNPSSNSSNNFSFSWGAPGFFIGAGAHINYCWSVNTPIVQDGSNCHWTGQGITQLASGPYATLQGTNTLYVSAKDETGNFDGTQSASVNFVATTTAPGAPNDLDVTDASIKATSTWKLAMSWSAPAQVGSGVASYKILRSLDNTNFTQVGSTSASNLSFVDSGLTQQLYYYKVVACDNADSCSVASNISSKKPAGRFTTPANLTSDQNQPRAESVGTKKATIVWFTDRESDSRVAFGTASGQYGAEEIGNSDQVTNHSVSLANLSPGTKYYYVTKWTDIDGNTGVSSESSFTTLPAPVVKEATATAINTNNATINFTIAAASQAKIYYGMTSSFGGQKVINTSAQESNYSLEIGDLVDGTKYFFRIDGIDSDGNQYIGNIYTFTTLPSPHISNVRFEPLSDQPLSTQKVSWQTNVPTSSEISYGVVGGAQLEQVDSTMTLDHQMIITNLIDDAQYSLVARSRDSVGNLAVSSEQIFHTALDTRPPVISDFNVEVSIRGNGASARGQVIVSWKTDEPATSAVAYGMGTDRSVIRSQTAEDASLSMDHVVVLSDLSPASVYQIQAVSYDKARNKVAGDNQSAIIGQAPNSVLSIILNTLGRIFGMGGNL